MPSWESILASAIVIFALIALVLIVVQILNAINLQKKKKYFSDLHSALKPGKEVMLSNGLYGKLVQVKEDVVIVEIAKGVEIKASRYSISEIIK